MISANAVKDIVRGSEPLTTPSSDLSFRKKDGTLGKPADDLKLAASEPCRFYNVEGEAVMRVFNDNVVDLNRANALRLRKKREVEETKAYQSWLYSFTSLNDGGAPERSVKLWHSKKKKLVKKKVNALLCCTLLAGEEWGKCSKTIEKYRSRSSNSRAEREVNAIGRFQLVHNSKYPANWVPKMSTQPPVEGNEHRARPVSVVEMLSVVRNSPTSQAVRKPEDQVIPVKLVNRSPINRPLAVLARKEEAICSFVGPKQPVASSPWREADNDDVYYIDGRLEVQLDLNMHLWLESEEYRLYQNTLAAPEGMRLWRYPDSSNFISPTKKQVRAFNKLFPPEAYNQEGEDEYGLEHYWSSLGDEARYTNWLAKMSVHTAGRRKNRRPSEGQRIGPRQRRVQFLDYHYSCGRMSRSTYLAARRRLLAANAAHKARSMVNFVLIGKPYGDQRRQPFLKSSSVRVFKGLPRPDSSVIVKGNSCRAERMGLDTMPPLPPMSQEEYDVITRSDPNSIDEHLFSLNLIGLKDYDTGQAAERYHRQQLLLKLGDVSIGESFQVDEKTGLVLPNYDDENVFEVLERVSQQRK